MSDGKDRRRASQARDDSEQERELRALLGAAGPRPDPPPETTAQLRKAAHAEWQKRWGAQPAETPEFEAERPAPWLLAAVLALLVLGLAWLVNRPSPDGPPPAGVIAEVPVEVLGSVLRVGGQAAWSDPALGSLDEGVPVVAGASLVTGPQSFATAELADGLTVRLDQNSQLEITSRATVSLSRGAVYVDSGSDGDTSAHLRVVTVYGEARDIGTQFEVRLLEANEEEAKEGDSGALRIRVREGRVDLAPAAADDDAVATLVVLAGEELRYAVDGPPQRRSVDPFGTTWQWVAAAAPKLPVDGREIRQVLAAIAREHGLELVEAASVADQLASRMSGSPLAISNLEEALRSVALASDLEVSADAKVLRVSARG